jgi:hypothetical protein
MRLEVGGQRSEVRIQMLDYPVGAAFSRDLAMIAALKI